MTYLIESPSTDPRWNLALEQYVFDRLDRAHSYIMLWRNANAIIVGKYQNTAREVDAAYVREHDIRVVRRLSGGGAVYHDLGNLNFTFIVDDPAGEAFDFSLFCRPVIALLRELGVDARMSGRNDMTVDGKKFSGNAQYRRRGRLMHHGTILFDSDMAVLGRALTPPKDKIVSKGTASVVSRVTNLRPLLQQPLDIGAFQAALHEHLYRENSGALADYALTAADCAAVDVLVAERYGQWSWNWGSSPAYSVEKVRRVEGCGRIEVHMDVRDGLIREIALFGDFFGGGDLAELAGVLRGASLEPAALSGLLSGVDVGRYVHNLTVGEFVEILTE